MNHPLYPLRDVKKLVEKDKISLSKTKAMDSFPTPEEAVAFAKRVTRMLTVRNFSSTVVLAYDRADVYGIRIDGCGRYVKLYIDDDGPETSFISLHPLQHAIETNAGTVQP